MRAYLKNGRIIKISQKAANMAADFAREGTHGYLFETLKVSNNLTFMIDSSEIVAIR